MGPQPTGDRSWRTAVRTATKSAYANFPTLPACTARSPSAWLTRPLEAATNVIAGTKGWESVAGWSPADVDFKLIHFATPAEAEAMQRWIAESGIEMRPAPERYAMFHGRKEATTAYCREGSG